MLTFTIFSPHTFCSSLASIVFLFAVLVLHPAAAQADSQADVQGQTYVISTDLFLEPRSGESLIQVPGFRAAAQSWIDGKTRRLTIRYPGGEDGTFWARELRDWLVALGVASSNIELLPGTPTADALVIEPW